MAHLRVIWVGKTRQGFAREGVAFYSKRLAPYFSLDCVTLRSASHSSREPQTAVDAESEAILKKVPPGETLLLLDEKGRTPTTREFADLIREHLEEKGERLVFVLGGPHGVNGSVRERAEATISLSRLTLPHQLARVILLEQLYRAATLLAGHAYHHE